MSPQKRSRPSNPGRIWANEAFEKGWRGRGAFRLVNVDFFCSFGVKLPFFVSAFREDLTRERDVDAGMKILPLSFWRSKLRLCWKNDAARNFLPNDIPFVGWRALLKGVKIRMKTLENRGNFWAIHFPLQQLVYSNPLLRKTWPTHKLFMEQNVDTISHFSRERN